MLNLDQTENIQSALANQRLYIAQMMHDDVCGNLAALLHDMHWIVNHSNQADVRERANISLQTVNAALAFSRQVMTDLHPEDLADGLPSAIDSLVSRFSHRTGIQPSCDLDIDLQALPDPLHLLIYRTIQESLINILKHANASKISISLCRKAGQIRLQIADNGKGLKFGNTELSSGMGLRSQFERAQAVGGYFEIRPAKNGQGTCVELIVPLNQPLN